MSKLLNCSASQFNELVCDFKIHCRGKKLLQLNMASEKKETTYSPLICSEEGEEAMESSKSRPSLASLIFFKFIRTCVAEMLGTMTFVFVDVCSVGLNLGVDAGFTHGFILFVNVAATATVR